MRVDAVCTRCGNKGPGLWETRGSTRTEVLLYLPLLVPGMLYSAWRRTGRAQRCRRCGSTDLVPETSPEGRRILTLLDSEEVRSPLRQLGRPRPATTTAELEKECPECAERIKVAARVCRYCGHRFDAREVALAVEQAQATLTAAQGAVTWRGRRCPICDTQNGPEVPRCRHCGDDIGSVPVTVEW